MFSSWRRARRMRHLTTEFWNLVGRSEVAAALAFFEQSLAPWGIAVPKAVRSAYHFLRWCEGGAEADFQAVNQLATGMPGHSQLARAAQVAQQSARQRHLARALNAGQATGPLPPRNSSADPAAIPLERLAELLLAWSAASSPGASTQPGVVADGMLRALPAVADLPVELRWGAQRLFVWAAFASRRFSLVCREHARIHECLGAQADLVLQEAARAWGRDALVKGDVRQAQAALDGLAILGRDAARQQAVLDWGVAALQAHVGESVVQWFFHHAQQRWPDDPPGWRAMVIFGLAVSLLQQGRYSEGREALERWLQYRPATNESVSPDHPLDAELMSQGWYLLALSLLATTCNWAAPTHGRAAAAVARDRELVVQNRALWRTLRGQLRDLLAHAAERVPADVWWAQLLEGMLASVDSELVLDLPRLEKFSTAIERVESHFARERLKTMEGALLTKLKATEEAVELLRRDDVSHLRELKQAVLDGLGDAIPPTVRAAVAMTLWNADASYDPLPDLQQIPLQAENEGLIQRCIQQVRVAQTLRRLTETLWHSGASDELLPSLETLVEFDADVAAQGRLATALILLQRGDLPAAQGNVPEACPAEYQEVVDFLRFYLAWRQADLPTCRKYLAAGIDRNRYLTHGERAAAAVRVSGLLHALRAGQSERVGELVLELGGGAGAPRQLVHALVCLVASLLERGQPQEARLLLNCAPRETGGDASVLPSDMAAWRWTCVALDTLVAARLGQYTVCVNLAGALGAGAPPATSGFGGVDANQRILGWCLLLKLEAELAQAAQTAEQGAASWRVVRRELEAQSAALEAFPHLRPYLNLLSGLVTYLGTDMLVSDETIAKLHAAQQALSLQGKAGFIERVVAQLRWRKQVIDDFWNHLGTGDFHSAREIFHHEVQPALGERVPESIKLGVVLADWGCGAAPTGELLHRLDLLQHDASELATLIDRVRKYLLDGETVRQLIRLLQTGEFHQIVELAERTVWTGMEEGAMPIPVAIAKLYAMYRLENTDQAQRFASLIADNPHLETWVTDYGRLLLGYIHFQKAEKESPAAASAFERISTSTVLGHDVDRYWAAAHFSHGLQLLSVDKQEQAFEAFARSLSKRGSAADNTKLAPLFIHFGIKSIEERNGSRARHAFQVIADSIKGQADSARVIHDRVLANLGGLLCRALMDEDVEDLGGEKFLELLATLQPWTKDQDLPPGFPLAVELALRRLAICQELRRELRRNSRQRRDKKQLYRYLTEQAGALEKLLAVGVKDPAAAKARDPVLLVLQGVADLQWGGSGKLSAALENVNMAMQLGVQSLRLANFVDSHRQQIQKAAKEQVKVLDLFDAYLANGNVPGWVRQEFVRRDNVAELYRIHRNCTPEDLFVNDGTTGLSAWRARLQHLMEFIKADGLANDERLKARYETLGEMIKQVDELEAKTTTAEREILSVLAERLRSQSIELA